MKDQAVMLEGENLLEKVRQDETDKRKNKLAKVLEELKEEGYKVRNQEDIERYFLFSTEADILAGRENFSINYNRKGEFKLETTWSNQEVTTEWLAKVTRLFNIIS